MGKGLRIHIDVDVSFDNFSGLVCVKKRKDSTHGDDTDNCLIGRKKVIMIDKRKFKGFHVKYGPSMDHFVPI